MEAAQDCRPDTALASPALAATDLDFAASQAYRR
jgi:hypothetical protein